MRIQKIKTIKTVPDTYSRNDRMKRSNILVAGKRRVNPSVEDTGLQQMQAAKLFSM
jgi:hypothetical protein